MEKIYVLSLILSCIVASSVVNGSQERKENTNIFDDVVDFILDLFDYDSSEEDKNVVTCRNCTISVIHNKTELATVDKNSGVSVSKTTTSTSTSKSTTTTQTSKARTNPTSSSTSTSESTTTNQTAQEPTNPTSSSTSTSESTTTNQTAQQPTNMNISSTTTSEKTQIGNDTLEMGDGSTEAREMGQPEPVPQTFRR